MASLGEQARACSPLFVFPYFFSSPRRCFEGGSWRGHVPAPPLAAPSKTLPRVWALAVHGRGSPFAGYALVGAICRGGARRRRRPRRRPGDRRYVVFASLCASTVSLTARAYVSHEPKRSFPGVPRSTRTCVGVSADGACPFRTRAPPPSRCLDDASFDTLQTVATHLGARSIRHPCPCWRRAALFFLFSCGACPTQSICHTRRKKEEKAHDIHSPAATALHPQSLPRR
jgi:hypothetical protein